MQDQDCPQFVIYYYVRGCDFVAAEILILGETLVELWDYNVKEFLLLSLDLLRAKRLLSKCLWEDHHLDELRAAHTHYRLIPIKMAVDDVLLVLRVKAVSDRLMMREQVLQETDVAPNDNLPPLNENG